MKVDMKKLTGAEMIAAEKLAGEKILGNESISTSGLYAILHVWKKRENPKEKFEETLETTIGDLNTAFEDETNLTD